MTISFPDIVDIELIWIEKRIQYWLRFGDPRSDTIIDRRRKRVSFAPPDIFALVLWKSNDHGTVFSQINILQAVRGAGEALTIDRLSGPAISLLSVTGWPKVKRVLEQIDAVEALDIDPKTVCPDHWRHVQSRIESGENPRVYTPERHTVWLERGQLES